MKSRPLPLSAVMAIGFFVLCTTMPVSYGQPPDKLNVIVLMSDEHSFRVMGSSGNNIIKTPNIDKLGRSGVEFKAAYTQNPICVPARACFVTGMRPSKVGVFDNEAQQYHVLWNYPRTIARSFQDGGYNVEWLGKEHWSTNNEGVGFGGGNRKTYPRQFQNRYWTLREQTPWWPQAARTFDSSVNPTQEAIVTDLAIEYLQNYNSNKPWLLGVSLRMPHFPFAVEEKYYDMYKNTINLPRVTQGMLDNVPLQNFQGRDNAYPNMTPQQTKFARAVYYGMVTHMDEMFGKVINYLEQSGKIHNTVIVYVSDHGEHAGERTIWYKNSFHEDAARIPLIMHYPPAFPAGKKVYSPVQLIDVFPTLCDLCGVSCPFNQLDGKSLMPVVRGQENGNKRHAISEYFAYGTAGRMVRKNKWKYVWYSAKKGFGPYLFNMKNDPWEENNLYNNSNYANRIRALHKLAMKDFVYGPWYYDYGRRKLEGRLQNETDYSLKV